MNLSNLIDRLLKFPKLAIGKHEEASREMCIMEAEAYIAGERHSDRPACVDPVLADMARRVNDWMTQDERDEFLAPMLGQFAGTIGTEGHRIARACIVFDYTFRRIIPIYLRVRGRNSDATALELFPPIENLKQAEQVAKLAQRHAAAAANAAAAAYADAAAYAATAANAAANAYAAANAAAYADARPEIVSLRVAMLKELIAVHSTAPKEWSRKPETLPCLIER
jgi:hypothetical protein